MLSVRSRVSQVAAIFLLVAANVLAASNGTLIPLKGSASPYGSWFTAELQFGNQTLSVIADTGSADLWVLAPDWKCYAGSKVVLFGTAVSRDNCPLNQSYTPSSTFEPNNDAWFAEVYGQADVVGTVGFEDVQIGPIALQQQEFGLVNATVNGVDASVSGIMGLAFPILGAVHPGNYHLINSSTLTKEDLIEELLKDRLAYPTVIKRLESMDMTYFSFALERLPLKQEVGFGGYLAFETLPPISHGDFVTVPVEQVKNSPALITNGTTQKTYWTLTVEAVEWDNETNSQPFQAVVDTGNSLNYLPTDITEKINAAFDPPGKFYSLTGWYAVECNATPPANVSVQIGGQMFAIDSADMIWSDTSGHCWSSVAGWSEFVGTETGILGDAFLYNVVAVFDYSKEEMKFAPRQANSSTPTSTPSSGATVVGLDGHFLSLALAAVLVILTVC